MRGLFVRVCCKDDNDSDKKRNNIDCQSALGDPIEELGAKYIDKCCQERYELSNKDCVPKFDSIVRID